MSLSSKLCGVKKNRYGYNIAILVKSLNQHGANRYGSMLIQRFDLNRNIVAVSFFCDTAILQKKFLRFDPTLGSNNSGLKNYSILNHHIFGISRTSAFIWHIWIPLKKNCKTSCKRCILNDGNPLYCLPQNCLLVGIPEVGNSECINHQNCLP